MNLKQIIAEEVKRQLKEMDSKIDKNKPFAVVRKGGSIGDQGYNPKFKGAIVATFDTAEEAKEYAAHSRKQLSPGEKSYYKITYNVVRLK